MNDRQQPAKRHAAGLAHHVLLGDAALEEAIRETCSRERHQAHVENEVGVERDEVRPPRGRRKQRFGIGREQRA